MPSLKATIFDLGSGIGVCHFRRSNLTYVAEVNMDGRRVLPQSVREVRATIHAKVKVSDEATTQDLVDRATLGLIRFRDRLATFDHRWADTADLERWIEQAIDARDELATLIQDTVRA